MKLQKSISLLLLFTMTVFLLTACKTETSYIHDQQGKSIPITNSDSDTYTFKLSAQQIEDLEEPSVEVLEETISEEVETLSEELPPEEAQLTTEPEIPSQQPASVGPKTGEP